MISGRQALATIERAIARLRGDESRLEAALRSASEEAARRRVERTECLRALARVRLDTFAREGIVGELDSAERRALDQLGEWRTALAALAARRQAAERAVAAATAARDEASARFEAALDAIARFRAEHEARLRAGEEWTARKRRADEAVRIAEEANRKAVQAEIDRKEKGKPYEADPLFSYLWSRKFGTGSYEAGPLVRFVDRKVARLIGYDRARANYAMLTEIPLRLREHAARCKRQIDAERDALLAFEQAELRTAGLGRLEEAAAAAKTAFDAAEEDLLRARAALARLEAERDDPGGQERLFTAAVEILAAADGREDIAELRREAAATRTKEDDAIVRHLDGIDQAIRTADEEIAAIRTEMRELARRRTEIERERDAFHRRGYDHPAGTFGNEGSLADVLAGILTGALAGSKLGDALRDGWRTPPGPWGGPWGGDAGGFPFPRGGSGDEPRGPWGGRVEPPSQGDDRGGSGDGFRTGGTF